MHANVHRRCDQALNRCAKTTVGNFNDRHLTFSYKTLKMYHMSELTRDGTPRSPLYRINCPNKTETEHHGLQHIVSPVWTNPRQSTLASTYYQLSQPTRDWTPRSRPNIWRSIRCLNKPETNTTVTCIQYITCLNKPETEHYDLPHNISCFNQPETEHHDLVQKSDVLSDVSTNQRLTPRSPTFGKSPVSTNQRLNTTISYIISHRSRPKK